MAAATSATSSCKPWHCSQSRLETQHNQLVNAEGEPLAFTFLDGQGGFDRMLLPYKRTLAQIGINMNIRRIDSAQYVNRLNARDYDMIVTVSRSHHRLAGRELYNLSAAAPRGRRVQLHGAARPGGRHLIDGLVKADTREAMVHYARALDRVLQWGYYMIPNYYSIGTPCGGTASACPGATGLRRRPQHLVGSQPAATTQQMHAQLAGASDMLRYLSALAADHPDAAVHLVVNFVIVQAAPGGPVEQAIARLQGFGGPAWAVAAKSPRRAVPGAAAVAWTRR
jgi:hypothetical protein